MKVSEWLAQLGTHDILEVARARADFEKETGEAWPAGDGYTPRQMRRQIDARGKGGSIKASDKDMKTRLIGTLEVAEACADKFVPQPWYHNKMGMGFAVRECIRAIAETGH